MGARKEPTPCPEGLVKPEPPPAPPARQSAASSRQAGRVLKREVRKAGGRLIVMSGFPEHFSLEEAFDCAAHVDSTNPGDGPHMVFEIVERHVMPSDFPVPPRPSVSRSWGEEVERRVIWIDGAFRDARTVRVELGAYLRDCGVSWADSDLQELLTLRERSEAHDRRYGAKRGDAA